MEEKDKWDPDVSKRGEIKSILEKFIPEFSVRTGGSTSIDITRPGIDKAYGIRKLRDLLGISIGVVNGHRRLIIRMLPWVWGCAKGRLKRLVCWPLSVPSYRACRDEPGDGS